MNQRQNQANKSETKIQFKAKNVYKAGGSHQNIPSNNINQQKTSGYKKINNTTSNKEKILHRSVKRNFDQEGNAIITTKIIREVGDKNGENNINSKSMINSKSNARNYSYGINNEQERKYVHYSNYSNNLDGENQQIIYGKNYEMFSPCSYNAYNSQIKTTKIGMGDYGHEQNLRMGQFSPAIPNYIRSNEYIGEKSTNYKRTNRDYNMNNNRNVSTRYNIESPYNLSKYSLSNDFTSPDRQYENFKNIQIEKIKGRQPYYNEKMETRNNQMEYSVEYNGNPDRDEELYELVDNMATLIQSHVRGLLVRKKVLRYISLAIYYQSFCDKIQDVLCIHVRNEVLNILKNKLKINNNKKYGNTNININNSNNNYKKLHASKSYYNSYNTENNYKINDSNIPNYRNQNANNYSNYITRKEVTEYSTYRNSPNTGLRNNYSGIYETNKITNLKKLTKNASYQNNLTSNFNRSYNTYHQHKKSEQLKSPSSRVIHYFVNSPCTNKTPHHRYYHEINTRTVNMENIGKNQMNNHRICNKCDEVRRMKKQDKFYITTTTEKREDEYERYEYEKKMKYNQSSNDIFTHRKNIENDNYLSVNIVKLEDKDKNSKSMKDIFTNTTKEQNKISKVESINIKTTKKKKTEQEIEEEINRRVKISIKEYEKIENEKRKKMEAELKEKERIKREKEKELEKQRKEIEEQKKKERLEKERVRKEEQIRIEKEKEKQRRENMEKERKEKEERIKKEREEKLIKEREERKRKEEQMRIEKEKQKKLKEEQWRLEQERKDKERIKKLQEEITKQTIKKTTNIKTVKMQEEKKINMSDYILKKDCQKNMEDMKSKLEKEYAKKIEMEKKRGLEEQKKYEERIEIKNKKEIEKIIEQQKRKEIERQRELEKEKEMQKRKEIELQKQREKEIQIGIKQEMEKQKEIMKQKELEEKNKKMKQMKINKVQEVNFKSIFPNPLSQKKVDEKNIEKNKEKALKLLKKYILFRGNHLLKLRKYFNDWRINVKNIVLQEFSKVIQDFCRTNLEISSNKRAINNWRKLGKKIYYKRRIKLLKMRPKINIKKKKLYELIRITKLNKAFSRRRYIHYMILVWYIYAKNIHRKRVNMKFLYENLLRTYMSLAKDIFGNNQYENPSVQDAMYEAVNTNKFSTSYQDDVPLARKHYAEMRRKKLLESKNKEYSASTAKIEIEKKEIKKSYYSKEKVTTEENDNDLSVEEKRKKELLNKYRKYRSMNRDLIWKKQHRFIASFENEKTSEEDNDNRKDSKENKNYKNINGNNNKINNISKKTYTENKSISKPIENKYSSNYNSNYNKTQGQKKIEIYEYKKVNDNNKYNNNISQPARKTKSESKDMEIKTNSYSTTNKYIGNTQNISTQKYTTVNKPNTSVNINVKNYTKDSKISQSNTNSIKIGPSNEYKKTEVTKTTISKEEFKPYVAKNITTKYETKETKGTNNISKNNNTTVISSNYQKNKDNNQIKTSNINVYNSKYLNTEGNPKDKKIENKYVSKVEKKVEIKTSGNTNKNEQNGKKIFTTKSFTSSRMNK